MDPVTLVSPDVEQNEEPEASVVSTAGIEASTVETETSTGSTVETEWEANLEMDDIDAAKRECALLQRDLLRKDCLLRDLDIEYRKRELVWLNLKVARLERGLECRRRRIPVEATETESPVNDEDVV